MPERDHSQPRPEGLVRLRWFGNSDAIEGNGRVDEMLALVAERWFASNHSPDTFAFVVVVERDGKHMTDEEADAYIRDELAVKRAIRESAR